jgi:hypothetical protein
MTPLDEAVEEVREAITLYNETSTRALAYDDDDNAVVAVLALVLAGMKITKKTENLLAILTPATKEAKH